MNSIFECMRSLFAQFHIIRSEIDGFVMPLVFALLPNKPADT